MGSELLFGVVILLSVCFCLVHRSQQKQIEFLKKAREKIQLEESRVFDFLHGLGEALSGDASPGELHRIIVENAIRILDAHGGALYLMARDAAALYPSYISKDCPPLLEIPPHVLAQGESNPSALQSYLRLHAIEPGEGVLGAVWRDKEPLLLAGQDSRLAALRTSSLKTVSAMFSPLLYGSENLGVLAVANGPMSTNFSNSDFAVFKAIVEQSAFALYNAFIYAEASEKKRMDADLLVAQEIQRILLPSSAPESRGFQINGLNVPARQVSGDYFDYIRVDEGRVGVAIADVSGKGVPASLIMAMCRSVLRSQAARNHSAADVLHKVNRQIYDDMKEDMFISMAYVILEDDENKITLCRAGHDAPLLYSAKDQTVSRLNPPGMALGIDSGDVFDRVTRDFSVALEPNDCLILYTDGVTEALDRKGLEFGTKRMVQSILASAGEGAPGIVKRVTEDLRDFVGAYPQNDDITLIVIRKK